jgi:hypothetical protein
MRIRPLALLLVLAFALPSLAVDKAHYRELNAKARALAKQGDWKGVRAVLDDLGKELPAPTPRYLLTVASVETHLGHKDEALKWLAKYAATGLQYDVAGDDDLKPLAGEPGLARIVEQMKTNSRTVDAGELACSLPMTDVMPEDITSDGGGFIVSSIQHHTLYRVRLPQGDEVACDMEDLHLEESAQRWPILAVSYDVRRNLIWASTSVMPGFAGIAKEDEGKAALVAIDAKGQVARRWPLDSDAPAVLGDMTLAPDGAVYVTDSIGGGVYRVRLEGKDTAAALRVAKLEKVADGLFSPQTPALAADRKRLFVADYTMGIAVVDLASGKVEYLAHPDDVAVTGIDGMYLTGDSLLAIQNGTAPERILRLKLDGAQRSIVSAEVVAQASDKTADATHAVLKDGTFYVITNVGWAKVGDDGQLKDGEKFTAPRILRLRK